MLVVLRKQSSAKNCKTADVIANWPEVEAKIDRNAASSPGIPFFFLLFPDGPVLHPSAVIIAVDRSWRLKSLVILLLQGQSTPSIAIANGPEAAVLHWGDRYTCKHRRRR